MLTYNVEWSLRHRWLVLLATLAVVISGAGPRDFSAGF